MALGNVSGIVLKHSLLLNDAPDPAELQHGELALNANSGSLGLFTLDESGNVVSLGGGGSGSASVTSGAVAPTTPAIGDIWVDISDPADPTLKINSSTGWVTIGKIDGITIQKDAATDEIGVGRIDVGTF